VTPKQADDPAYLTFPQGRIKEGDTALSAAVRVLKKALGVNHLDIQNGRIMALTMFQNFVAQVEGVKEYHVVGVKLSSKAMISPNESEVRDFSKASSPEQFLATTQSVAEKNLVKYNGMEAAIRLASARRLLPWSLPVPEQAPAEDVVETVH
jgi:hypothetical protein